MCKLLESARPPPPLFFPLPPFLCVTLTDNVHRLVFFFFFFFFFTFIELNCQSDLLDQYTPIITVCPRGCQVSSVDVISSVDTFLLRSFRMVVTASLFFQCCVCVCVYTASRLLFVGMSCLSLWQVFYITLSPWSLDL